MIITSFGCGVGGGVAKGFDEAVSVRHFFAADADGFIEKNSNREKIRIMTADDFRLPRQII